MSEDFDADGNRRTSRYVRCASARPAVSPAAVAGALALVIAGSAAVRPVARAQGFDATTAVAQAPAGPLVQKSKPPQKPRGATPSAKPAQDAGRKLQRINLLKRIDPARDSVQGAWRLIDGALILESLGPMDRIELPLAPPKVYKLRLMVERIRGTDCLAIGLPIGDRLPQIVVDGGGGTISGIAMVDGKPSTSNELTLRATGLLAAGATHEIVCEVAPGKLKVTCDARAIIDWSGDTNRLSADSRYPTPHSDRIYLAAWGVSFRISKIELELSGNTITPEIAKSGGFLKPRAPAREGMALRGPGAAQLLPPENRLAVPTADQQRSARNLIVDLYKDELAAARKRGGASFAEKLLSLARDTTDDPAARYVLIDLARELAAAEGDMNLTLRATEESTQGFNLDPLQARLQAAKTVVPGKIVAAALPPAVDSMLDLADDCLALDEFDLAAQAIKLARAIAVSAKDPALGKGVNARGKEITALAKQFEAVKPQLAALGRDPTDPKANLAVGRWYCFANEAWEQGLPLLAAGNDADLAAVAARDLRQPEAAPDQVSLGDAWWDLAQNQRDEVPKQSMLSRAAHWYAQAEPRLQGLVQLKVQQRLKSLGK